MELKGQPFPYPRQVPERRFWIGLSCVLLLHASAILGVGRSQPRHLGERDGSPDAISVEFVDPSELGGERAAPPLTPTNSPPSRAVAAADTGSTTSPPPAPNEAAPAASPSAAAPAAEAASPKFAAPFLEDNSAATSPSKGEAAAPPAPAETLAPPSADPPGATADPPMQATGKAKTSPKLSLQLDLPPNFVAPSGLSTAAVRPPDITRSGENDEFGRRVIRALRQTMPPARGEVGKVTVRLLLSATGDLSELQLVRPATDATLTQSVVFAVRQSSFPIPPTGATRSDRTFLVTYIYN
jgi:periplasmic protein TonB